MRLATVGSLLYLKNSANALLRQTVSQFVVVSAVPSDIYTISESRTTKTWRRGETKCNATRLMQLQSFHSLCGRTRLCVSIPALYCPIAISTTNDASESKATMAVNNIVTKLVHSLLRLWRRPRSPLRTDLTSRTILRRRKQLETESKVFCC